MKFLALSKYIRKFFAVHVDILLVVCYIANEATLKQFDRHLEAYCPKQRGDPFFVCIQYKTVFYKKCSIICLGISTCYLLHIIQNKMVFRRPQVKYSQNRQAVLPLYGTKQHHSGILHLASANVAAFKDQCRVIQNLRDLLDLIQCNFRMVVQNHLDFVTVHVNVTFDCTKPLQYLSGTSKLKLHTALHPVSAPLLNSLFKLRSIFIVLPW